MKYVKFDTDSEEIQKMLKRVAASSELAIMMSKSYKNDVSHSTNDLVYMTVLGGYSEAMKFIATILDMDDVSFEDLIKEIEK